MALRVLNRRSRAQQTADTSRPALVGMLAVWPTDTPPAGWLICDGTAFSGVTFPFLAAVLGGTTLPDMRGRTCVGQGTHADVNVVGDTDAASLATRRPNHPHTAGAGHFHDVSHTHTAAAHTHPTSDPHTHGSQVHSHTAANHGHVVTGSTGGANQGVSVDAVPSGSGTSSHNTSHTHGNGSLDGDNITPLPHTGYAGLNGGITSADNPGTTGSAAPATHTAGGGNSTTDATAAADAGSVPFVALHWIVKAA